MQEEKVIVHPPVRQVAYHDVYETNRVVDTKQRVRLCIHFWIVFIWSLALAIPTGIFLFNVEERNLCIAPIHANDFYLADRWVNVSRRYNVALSVFFTYWIVEAVRALLVLASTLTALHIITLVHTILCLNEALGIAAFVITSVFRFQFSGRYCACTGVSPWCDDDFFDEEREGA